ncbi:MAG: hypothetical protein ABIN00_02095 [candidate division WOR-3 bacterium]
MMSEILFLLLLMFILFSVKHFKLKSVKTQLNLLVFLYTLYKLLLIVYSKNESCAFNVSSFLTFYFDSYRSINILEILAIFFYFIFLLLDQGNDYVYTDKNFTIFFYFIVIPISTFLYRTSDMFIYSFFSLLIFLCLVFTYKNKSLNFITISVKVSFIIYFAFLISFLVCVDFLGDYNATNVLEISKNITTTSFYGSFFYLLFFTPLLFSFVFPLNIFLSDFISTMNTKQLSLFVLFLTFPSLVYLDKFLLVVPAKIINALFIIVLFSYITNIILLISPRIKYFKTFLFFTISNEISFLILFEHRFKTFMDTEFLFFYMGLFFAFLYSLSKFDFENDDDLKNSFIKQPTNSLIFFITSFSFTSLPLSILFLYQYRFLLILYKFEKILFWLYLVALILKSFALLRFDLKMLLVEKRSKSHLMNLIKNFNRIDFAILITIAILAIFFYHNYINGKEDNFGEYRKLIFKVSTVKLNEK